MHFLDRTLPTLADNLALDEALLLAAEEGGPEVLRLWEWPQTAVVLGAGGRVSQEVDEPACRHDRIPLARRGSGGGTVLLGPGCLLFSLVLSYSRHPALAELHPSYGFILQKLCAALEDLTPGLAPAGISDLAIGGRKVSGNAQQRKRTHVLHHGTLLYAFDLAMIERYLPPPPRQPEYRQDRTHGEFVANFSATREQLSMRLRAGFPVQATLESMPMEKTTQLVAEKYGQEAWIRRR